MRHVLASGVVLAALSGGCAMSIPETAPYPARPAPADPAPGYSLCSRTAVAARSLSSAQVAGMWTLGSMGLASTVGGVVATVVNDQQPRLMAASALTLGGVALGVIAYHLYLRSVASARLGQTADLAMLEKSDRQAFETCVRAKAAWEVSKTDSDGISRELLDQEERENKRLRQEIERLKRQVGEEPAGPVKAFPTPAP